MTHIMLNPTWQTEEAKHRFNNSYIKNMMSYFAQKQHIHPCNFARKISCSMPDILLDEHLYKTPLIVLMYYHVKIALIFLLKNNHGGLQCLVVFRCFAIFSLVAGPNIS